MKKSIAKQIILIYKDLCLLSNPIVMTNLEYNLLMNLIHGSLICEIMAQIGDLHIHSTSIN